MMNNVGAQTLSLDDAADIIHSDEARPGKKLADAGNWAGFVLLLFAALAGIGAVIATVAGFFSTGAISAVLAAVGIGAGMAVIAVVNRWHLRVSRGHSG
ncbi:hypothetical protein [Nocardia miyunensis]|uniref:hypothetical protein n=1 Tax=Nocardia miyunensis TaxID=282684 RepID=UPI0012F4CA94|nr:hypothetical protein [Nocardia miyunensis]